MNTEQRYFLAIFLSFLVLVIFYSPIFYPKKAHTPAFRESLNTSQEPVPPGLNTKHETQEVLHQAQSAQYYELENENYSAKFSSLGGGISELLLKESMLKKSGSVYLVKPIGGAAAFVIGIPNQPTSIAQGNFKLERSDPNAKTIELSFEIANELRIRKRYALISDKTAFRLTVGIENLSSSAKQIPLELASQIYFGKEHTHRDQDQLESFVAPKNGKIRVFKESKMAKSPIVVSDSIDWQALTKQYFTVIVKPEKEAISAESKTSPERDALESTLKFAPEEVAPGGKFETSFLIYAGPEYYEDLKSFGFGFEQTLMQGTWGAVRHWLFFALRFCQKITGNYGFAILFMTFLIKVLFSPFTHMSFESMRKMQVVQPKVKSIQTQFKNDPTRMNKEMMELYRRHKVNPMGGCLPMIIQIPIFISFYQVLSQFVELKGVSLWWIKDLTQPDRLTKIPGIGIDFNLLPILMIGTMIWQQKVTPQQSMSSPEQAKMMQFMPIMFGFFFYQLPAGLVLYWTLNNLLTVIHQKIFHHRTPQVSAE